MLYLFPILYCLVVFRTALAHFQTLSIPADLRPRGSSHAKTPTLPQSSLPPPPAGAVLKYIALGMGTQNYSCTTSNVSSIGALATLYDITDILTEHPELIPTFPEWASHQSGWNDNRKLGSHYFKKGEAQELVPIFDLACADPVIFISAEKVASAPAPSSSGAQSGAVDWFYLKQNPKYYNSGNFIVYRVETVGGVAPASCGEDEVRAVPYTAEYWIYEDDNADKFRLL